MHCFPRFLPWSLKVFSLFPRRGGASSRVRGVINAWPAKSFETATRIKVSANIQLMWLHLMTLSAQVSVSLVPSLSAWEEACGVGVLQESGQSLVALYKRLVLKNISPLALSLELCLPEPFSLCDGQGDLTVATNKVPRPSLFTSTDIQSSCDLVPLILDCNYNTFWLDG